MPTAPRSTRPKLTIDELITAYLAALEDPSPAPGPAAEEPDGDDVGAATHEVAAPDPHGSLDLLRHGLNGYGYQYLGKAELGRYQAAFDAGDEEAFCRTAGASAAVKYLDEFVGYFLIRKVMMRDDEVAGVVEDVRAFVAWLRDRGAIAPAAAKKALGRLAEASVDLPAADRLGEILYGLAAAAEKRARAGERIEYEEVVDDYLVIERVAPGRIWFLDHVGPIKVPEAASGLARPGWTISLVLGRRGTQWDVLEAGNVYPETLA